MLVEESIYKKFLSFISGVTGKKYGSIYDVVRDKEAVQLITSRTDYLLDKLDELDEPLYVVNKLKVMVEILAQHIHETLEVLRNPPKIIMELYLNEVLRTLLPGTIGIYNSMVFLTLKEREELKKTLSKLIVVGKVFDINTRDEYPLLLYPSPEDYVDVFIPADTVIETVREALGRLDIISTGIVRSEPLSFKIPRKTALLAAAYNESTPVDKAREYMDEALRIPNIRTTDVWTIGFDNGALEVHATFIEKLEDGEVSYVTTLYDSGIRILAELRKHIGEKIHAKIKLDKEYKIDWPCQRRIEKLKECMNDAKKEALEKLGLVHRMDKEVKRLLAKYGLETERREYTLAYSDNPSWLELFFKKGDTEIIVATVSNRPEILLEGDVGIIINIKLDDKLKLLYHKIEHISYKIIEKFSVGLFLYPEPDDDDVFQIPFSPGKKLEDAIAMLDKVYEELAKAVISVKNTEISDEDIILLLPLLLYVKRKDRKLDYKEHMLSHVKQVLAKYGFKNIGEDYESLRHVFEKLVEKGIVRLEPIDIVVGNARFSQAIEKFGMDEMPLEPLEIPVILYHEIICKNEDYIGCALKRKEYSPRIVDVLLDLDDRASLVTESKYLAEIWSTLSDNQKKKIAEKIKLERLLKDPELLLLMHEYFPVISERYSDDPSMLTYLLHTCGILGGVLVDNLGFYSVRIKGLDLQVKKYGFLESEYIVYISFGKDKKVGIKIVAKKPEEAVDKVIQEHDRIYSYILASLSSGDITLVEEGIGYYTARHRTTGRKAPTIITLEEILGEEWESVDIYS